MASHIVGYPRMGPKRELKFALESFWDGKSSADDLQKVAADLRSSIWKQIADTGIKFIPSYTFSFYDQVLDTTAMLGAVPPRYGWTGGEIGFDIYFSMARGNATLPAMEMTKWFDTNYHFIVPELGPDMKFSYASHKAVNEYKEAKALGVDTVPVLIGPVSYLLNNEAVQKAAAALKGSDHRRAANVTARLDAQQKKLNLPILPTTTIGSFPQTMDLRRVRREYKANKISEEKGLCYNCDEKFGPGHRCKNQQIFLLEVVDEVEDIPDDDIADEEDSPAISIHALSCYSSPQTMRIQGRIKQQLVSVLIDSGSTHNFISKKIPQLLALPTHQSSSFDVLVADGNRLECSAKCLALEINIQGYQFHTDVYLLPLKASDVVLGVQWLRNLGPVTWDFQNLTMDFTLGGQDYHLQGQPRTSITPAIAQSMERILRHQSHGMIMQLTHPIEGHDFDPEGDAYEEAPVVDDYGWGQLDQGVEPVVGEPAP